jgi:ParB family chromosome partitioning protein
MADIQPTETGPAQAAVAPRPAEQSVPVERLFPNPDQPRRAFSDGALEELAASIREKGVIQPLIVRPNPSGDGYQIVAGERRWRAAQRAQVHELPVIIRDFDDTEVLEVAIIENIQRADLNPDGRGAGISPAAGSLRPHAGTARDRHGQEPEPYRQSHAASGTCRMMYWRCFATAGFRGTCARPDHDRRSVDARPSGRGQGAVRSGGGDDWPRLGRSVRRKGKAVASLRKDADTRALESDLSAALGMSVSISHDTASGSGKIGH